MTRKELLAEARAIHQCDYDERAGRPTEIEARLASEVVALLRERDEARARIARYVAAVEARAFAADIAREECDYEAWAAADARLEAARDACDAALAALRETPAGEGER